MIKLEIDNEDTCILLWGISLIMGRVHLDSASLLSRLENLREVLKEKLVEDNKKHKENN